MSYRFMRVLVMFDLPVLSSNDRKEYRAFRKFLLTTGFYMMQESIYVKLVLNAVEAEKVKNYVKKYRPGAGIVQLLVVTEKQFSKMEVIVGEVNSEVISSTDRLVVL